MNAQEFRFVKFVTDSSRPELSTSFNSVQPIVDSIQVLKLKDYRFWQLVEIGYPETQIRESGNGDTLVLLFATGKKWRSLQIRNGNIPIEIAEASGLKINKQSGAIESTAYQESVLKMLHFLENNGYPFASVSLDSFIANENQLIAMVLLDKGPYTVYGETAINGSAKVKRWYIERYCGMKSGSIYKESDVVKMKATLNQLPFITLRKDPLIYFEKGKAIPIVSLDYRKSGTVDGLIGFAPDNSKNNGKLLVTGEANVKLQNLFETGKYLEVNYRSFLGNSQDFRFRLSLPYLLRSPLGMDYDLHILKQDSSWLKVKNEVGVFFRFYGSDQIRISIGKEVSTLLSVDTSTVKLSGKLPVFADMDLTTYGLSARFTRLDYPFNPLKGYFLEGSVYAADRIIRKNETLDELKVNGKNLYEGMSLRSTQIRILLQSDLYLKLAKVSTWRVQINGGYVQSPDLFINDLFRIGGLRTLKGFDEQSIFADRYLILNTEYRYLTGKKAHVMIFWNGAAYQNKVVSSGTVKYPWGFGGGGGFETNAGVFSIYYALGTAADNSLQYSQGKVHFGFINYF